MVEKVKNQSLKIIGPTTLELHPSETKMVEVTDTVQELTKIRDQNREFREM